MSDLGTLGYDYAVATDVNNAGLIVGYSMRKPMVTEPVLWRRGRIQAIDVPAGQSEGNAEAVNEHGQIAGESIIPMNRAFVWARGRPTDLGLPAGSYSRANGINNHGRIVGVSNGYPGPTPLDGAFVWDRGRITVLLAPRGITTPVANDINDRDWVVGESAVVDSGPFHAVLWNRRPQPRP
jgi:uncharacterized membrane protein